MQSTGSISLPVLLREARFDACADSLCARRRSMHLRRELEEAIDVQLTAARLREIETASSKIEV